MSVRLRPEGKMELNRERKTRGLKCDKLIQLFCFAAAGADNVTAPLLISSALSDILIILQVSDSTLTA